MSRFTCLHRHTREGGDLPPGKWCTSCGRKVIRRASAADRAVDRRGKERSLAQQLNRTMTDLARKRPLDP